MKTRESGMPDEEYWSSFFQPEWVLTQLGLTGECNNVVEFGCGYGTFTIPAASKVRGVVYAVDIERGMIELTAAKAKKQGLQNVNALQRDFVSEGTGLPDHSMNYAMLFNILHADQPDVLLQEAWRGLSPGGLLGIMHWNYDPSTPRGPSMSIRPRPEQCRTWAESVGFTSLTDQPIPLPPYHYGWIMQRVG